jgi:hypothetical protein
VVSASTDLESWHQQLRYAIPRTYIEWKSVCTYADTGAAITQAVDSIAMYIVQGLSLPGEARSVSSCSECGRRGHLKCDQCNATGLSNYW